MHPSRISILTRSIRRVRGWLALAGCACLLAATSVSGQSAATGSIEGRALNADTGRYVANAVVTVVDTNLRSITDDFGRYRFDNVPAGEVRIRATYIGRDPIVRSVTVRPGETTLEDFSFSGRIGQQPTGTDFDDPAFELAEFEVTAAGSYQTGAQIAIAEERFSVNIKNVVSAEAFGDVPEGNVGEFVKFIPGILIGYGGEYASGADATQISVRGFPPHQTNIMIDGVPISNAQPGSLTRAAGLDMLSINNAARVEVTKVPTPDMRSDAIGGSINLISKSAFEYAEPFFSWRAYLSINSDNTNIFKRTPGPGSERTYKGLPGFDLTYVLPLNDRVGVTVTAASSNQFNENQRADIRWNRTPNTQLRHPDGALADARNPYISSLQITDRPRNSHRHSGSVKLDYAPWDGHVFTFNYQGAIYDSVDYNRILALDPRSSPSDWGPDYVIGGSNTGQVRQTVRSLDKEGTTHSGYFRWRYLKGPWDGNVHISRSVSESSLNSTENGHFSEFEIGLPDIDRVVFRDIQEGIPGEISVINSDQEEVDYTQIDNYYLSQSNVGALRVRAGNTDTDERINVYKFDLRREFDFLPFDWMNAGLKIGAYREEHQITKSGRGTNYVYEYVGAVEDFNPGAYVDTIYRDIEPGYGIGPMQWADLYKLYDFYLEDPSRWSDANTDTTRRGTAVPGTYQSAAASNWVEYVNTNKNITETSDAYYFMLDSRFFNRLTVVGGVRWEGAKRKGYGPWIANDALYLRNPDGSIFQSTVRRFEGPVPVTSQGRWNNEAVRAEIAAAGITWDRLIEANSLEAAQLQYQAMHPLSNRTDTLPAYSVHTTYDVTDELVFRAAFARTHGQVDFEDGILATTSYNRDENARYGYSYITVGNPTLEPWKADQWDFSLTYYTETGGKFGVNYFVKNIDNFHDRFVIPLTSDNYLQVLGQLGLPAQEYLVTEGWEVRTTVNLPDPAKTTGWEFEASQSLGILDFLGDWGNRFYVFASYTMKEYSANQTAQGALGSTSDDFAAGGIDYKDSRFGLRLNFTWRDDSIISTQLLRLTTPEGGNTEEQFALYEYEPSEVKVDLNTSFRFYKNYELFANARNIFNTRTERRRRSVEPGLYPEYANLYDIRDFGVQITIGVRGSF